jgi:8-oxo-dGTP pyrophosphatase MutT (NUDIX family)
VLLVRLRWTRSGFKSLFHLLNGADPYTHHAATKAAQNCTDRELELSATGCRSGTTHSFRFRGSTRRADARLTQRRAGEGARCMDPVSKNNLTLPKGEIDLGETDWVAALRELQEEAGVPPADVKVHDEIKPLREAKLTVFVATLAARIGHFSQAGYSRRPRGANRSGYRCRWFRLDRLKISYTGVLERSELVALLEHAAGRA